MMQVCHLIAIILCLHQRMLALVPSSHLQFKNTILVTKFRNEINFVEMLFNGEGPFTNCLELHPDQSGGMILNCNIFGVTDKVVVVDEDEQKSDLKKPYHNNYVSLSGGTITKKVKSFASRYMRNGTLPSGKNDNDLIRYVEEKMFVLDNEWKDKVYNTSKGYKFPKMYAIFCHSVVPPLLRPESFHKLKCLAELDSNIGPRTGRHMLQVQLQPLAPRKRKQQFLVPCSWNASRPKTRFCSSCT